MRKIIIPILFLLIFTSCKNDKVYLTAEQRSLLLYDVGDKFTLVKNDTDTLNFEVTKKEFTFGDDYNGLFSTGTYYERGYLEYNSNNTSSIYVGENLKAENFQHYFKESSNLLFFVYYTNTTNFTLNNKLYNHTYLLTSYSNDTMYISTDIGILYIKSQNGDEYKLLEE